MRIVVGVAAGSAPDIFARLMGQWLSDRLGQPFVVENRPGAGTNIATETVVRAAPDGHTLLLVSAPNAINATLYDKLNFNFRRDIAPVGSIVDSPEVMVVHPSVPARTIPEFIAYAKANPGKLTMASPGIGSGPHMSGELFKWMAGIDMTHVPYRGGGPAKTDLIGGQVLVTFSAPAVTIEHIRAGTLRALAVTTATRSHVLPDIPPMAEFLPGYRSGGFFGIGAPRGTPSDIVDRLNKEINAALIDPTIKARFNDNRLVRDADGGVRAVATGEHELIPCGLVIRSIGYRGRPLPGVPFDERRGLIRNDGGRVCDEDGARVPASTSPAGSSAGRRA